MGPGPKQRDIGSFFAKAAKPADGAPKDAAKENKRAAGPGAGAKKEAEVCGGRGPSGRCALRSAQPRATASYRCRCRAWHRPHPRAAHSFLPCPCHPRPQAAAGDGRRLKRLKKAEAPSAEAAPQVRLRWLALGASASRCSNICMCSRQHILFSHRCMICH